MFKQSLIALALASTIGTVVSAQTGLHVFAPPMVQEQNASNVDVGTVRAPSGGTIEIHDYRLGTQGDLLGSLPVSAGVHADLQVPIHRALNGNVLATLIVDGQIVGRQMVHIQG